MSLALRAMSLVLFLSVCAQAQNRTLALYSGPVTGLDPEARGSMRLEMQRLFAPAGLDIVWKNLGDRNTGEDFELVVVASFEGSCSKVQPMMTPVHVSLADTSISDGQILPFLRVDCTRIVQIIGNHAKPALVGRAVARVIAHEIYHIVGHTTEHSNAGVAKAMFSSRDLLNPRFEFQVGSLGKMRPGPLAAISGGWINAAR